MKGQPTEIWKIYNRANSTLEIPVYQRNYDWQVLQCARLFDDLENLANADRAKQPKHFFGAVVGKSETSWKWVVIDGQQRLTTISLLILALAHAAEAGEIAVEEDSDLARKLVGNFLLVDNDPNNLKFKLKPVKNDAAAYQALFGPEADFVESSNVTSNYRYFRGRLRATNLSADQIWDAITGLEVMHLDLEAHDDPQSIFESLNSTGLNLSEADKIRNFVLMNQELGEQNRLYEHRWNPMEENVDYRTDWFIRLYLTGKMNNSPRESDVFEVFKRYTQRSKDSVPQILDDMFEYSKASRDITHASTGFPAVDRRLRRANLILGDVVHPFLMEVVADAGRGEITEEDLDDVVRIVESYIFRRYICQIAANSLSRIFATAHSEMRKLRTQGQSYADLLTWILRRRDGGSGRFPLDADFRASLGTRDMYHLRPAQRQYLFDVLENGESKDNRDIADKIQTGELTIEHIMPQTLTAAWLQELGPGATEVHEVWKDRIGNLTVTGYNSAYSNSSFEKKKTMPEGFDSSPYRLNSDVKSAEHWTEDAMSARNQRLTQQALEYWQLAETEFRPPEVVRPKEPMGDDTSFLNKVITGYEFGDVSETVTDWTNLMPKVLGVLLELNRGALIEFAKTEPLLTTSPQPHVATRGFRLIDPGLGVWGNNSTETKVALLRRIFAALNLDTEDLVFTLRPNAAESEEVKENAALVEKEQPHAALTKFRDAVDEAAALSASVDDTADLRAEMSRDFAEFHRDSWFQNIGGKSPASYIASTPVEEMSEEQVLTALSALFGLEAMAGPGPVHQAIVDGSMGALLARLGDLEVKQAR